jgi:hypothetical protein
MCERLAIVARRLLRRRVWVSASAALVALSFTWTVEPAHATFHNQQCTKDNGDYCYDVQGAPTYFYPWQRVDISMIDVPSGLNYVCAGATKTDGTFKTNSGCAQGRTGLSVYFDAPSSVSQARGRWRGTGPTSRLWVYAWT